MNVQPYQAVLPTPFGALGIRSASARIVEIAFLPPGVPALVPSDAASERAWRQLEHYLRDPDIPFDLPLSEAGTAFQRRVWSAIAAIPCGQTLSYGGMARQLGSAARAVGQACGRNPYPIVVPCHRVISADGALGGFAGARDGYLLQTKRWLLHHEAAR